MSKKMLDDIEAEYQRFVDIVEELMNKDKQAMFGLQEATQKKRKLAIVLGMPPDAEAFPSISRNDIFGKSKN